VADVEDDGVVGVVVGCIGVVVGGIGVVVGGIGVVVGGIGVVVGGIGVVVGGIGVVVVSKQPSQGITFIEKLFSSLLVHIPNGQSSVISLSLVNVVSPSDKVH